MREVAWGEVVPRSGRERITTEDRGNEIGASGFRGGGCSVERYLIRYHRRTVVRSRAALSRSYQRRPSIMQLSPLPMPRKAVLSPGWRNPRSLAIAAVMGRDTEPMLPR